MATYWKSNPRYYCKVCKVWIADNKVQRRQHEEGLSHKEKAERMLEEMAKVNQKRRAEEEKVAEELHRINQAADRAYFADLHRGGRQVRSDAEQTYGTYDRYGGWYDAHGHYYTYRNERWDYVGLFPSFDFAPSSRGDDEAARKRQREEEEGRAEATAEDERREEEEDGGRDAKDLAGEPRIGEWTKVVTKPKEGRARSAVAISLPTAKQLRPGAEDSADEEEADANVSGGGTKLASAEANAELQASKALFRRKPGSGSGQRPQNLRSRNSS